MAVAASITHVNIMTIEALIKTSLRAGMYLVYYILDYIFLLWVDPTMLLQAALLASTYSEGRNGCVCLIPAERQRHRCKDQMGVRSRSHRHAVVNVFFTRCTLGCASFAYLVCGRLSAKMSSLVGCWL